MAYSKPIQNLIDAFSKLPTVGKRTAERFVFYLLKSGKKDVGELTIALKELIGSVKSCEICWDFSDQSPCAICANPKRNQQTICVVAEPQDLQAIERVGEFPGTYHVLRGLLKADDERALSYIKIKELVSRIKERNATEIILALNPDMHGETTMMYLERVLKKQFPDLTVSRLARGLPMGSDLQYADDVTLGSALKHRTKS